MAASLVADREKEKVRAKIDARYPLVRYQRRRSCFLTKDQQTVVNIIYSREEDLFYGMKEDDLLEWDTFPRGFVVFVLGHSGSTLVVPLKIITRSLDSFPLDGSGNRKFHLRRHNGYVQINELAGDAITWSKYRNNYDQLAG